MSAPKADGGATRPGCSDQPTFTKRLCRTHRVWAVDATGREALPEGWHTLAGNLFDKVANVMVGRPVGMILIRDLAEEAGGLAADLCPLGGTAEARRAFGIVLRLVDRARRVSEATCSTCGEPGRLRASAGRYETLCDAHARHAAYPEAIVSELRAMILEGTRPVADHGQGQMPTPDEADAPIATTSHHRLYDLSDVGAALGRRRRGSILGADNDDDAFPAPEVGSDHQAFLRGLLGAGEAGTRRSLAEPGLEALSALDDLHRRAPHMAEVTGLVRRHLLAAEAMGLPISLPAMLLLGEPGVGKTWYLSRLASLLGVPHRRYPMSGQSLADGLVGGHPSWRNARPGLVARCLLAEAVANPLLLVDEVDKARTHATEDPYRAFYDLLEPEGARNFVDEYLGFPMDASRVLWILAGNELGPIPAPIVDRLTIVAVPAPDEAQLRAVVASVYDECNAARGLFFTPMPDEAATARLLATSPRGIRRAIAEGMTRAAADGRRALSPDDLVAPELPRRRIGFR